MTKVIETPAPQKGCWTLIAPDGRQWLAETPLRCVALERLERVPAEVAMDRIMAICGENQDRTDDRPADTSRASMAIDIMQLKLTVIKAACGLKAENDVNFLHRLEELYLMGYKHGLDDMLERSKAALTAGSASGS